MLIFKTVSKNTNIEGKKWKKNDEFEDEKTNLYEESHNYFNEGFKLPIHYLEKKRAIQKNILSDLELETTNESQTLYKHIFNPRTEMGKQCLPLWNKCYTWDKQFLTDSQHLYENFQPLSSQMIKIKCKNPAINSRDLSNEGESKTDNNGDLSNKMKTLLTTFYPKSKSEYEIDHLYNDWMYMKNDLSFLDKFNYVGWSKFEWLNRSEIFLELMSLYSFLSPLLALIVPIIFLLIPFFILKFKGIKIDLNQYITVLKRVSKNHILHQIFELGSANLEKKVYLIATIFFYIFQMFQNVLSCIKFHLNLSFIHDFIFKMRDYLQSTVKDITNYIHQTTDYTTYRSFILELNNHKLTLENLHDQIKTITPYKAGFRKGIKLGYLLQKFYVINQDRSFSESLLFSFGFHGYLDNITQLQKNIAQKNLNFCKLTNKTTNFKKLYYASLINEDPVKNNVNLKKHTIITGPNAAGKTTLLKSTLFNVILSQQLGCGFYEKASVAPYHYIHCYLNIPDTSGRDSLFQAEARRCKQILDNITNSGSDETHFCIFDELFSGTNPYEAVGSAYAYLEYLTTFKNVKFMLTTHFISLCKKMKSNKRIINCNMEVIKNEDTIAYTYKFNEGISNIKGGINVLKDLNYPDKIINKTEEIIKTLE